MVPRLPTAERKEIGMNICADIRKNTQNDPNNLENVITGDESGIFTKTQKVRANLFTWRTPVHQGKESTAEQIQIESNSDRSFDIRGIVHVDCVPEGQTVDRFYCKEVLKDLRESVRKRPEM